LEVKVKNTIEEKKQAIIDVVNKVLDNVDIEFDMSKRCKKTLATTWPWRRLIKFRRTLFNMTIESCQRCALHECAHIYQYEIMKYSNHDKAFGEILDMLIEDYGTPEIRNSRKSSRALAVSEYTRDY
jgi:hypothetical protein